ncbi:DNA-directed RNA polymerase subunit beta [Acholeplasma laidlawii]|uniref:DNA-directed RNA polymerase subunit beta n=2 Tax=Acholeplasma laidlawii TaxID=2148 RepID=RPOB_ACHLI|nr:DNA-directed RNA polymerase subunit beta [Acholeplasma laidlawii]A9NEL7.1 RecName: Full=DNA-directed RNA polymerase subunit beta; Short=RNAP subunit beta; AltName: Full=RNA polymerase subunit beta; AltName: Full=Transcriptase subunit beta [Acholeplasma laidlawii PG-8A]ABX80797.1 DNA-directed RNA polymerase, subunit beta [Acholeplasma laidlawii PG-8A]RED19888.1 DNA-directed RNA polymerase subunit beta [Acholeplasma laidlawii]SQH56398.1 DNA-directed RNA polymerase subunit beta [Acholeplasma la
MSYKTVKYGKKAERRDYSKMLHQVELPNLIEIQTKSFEEFVETGIDELLKDISPIEGHNGDLKLYFEESSLSEPKYSTIETKIRDLNYSRQLSARVKLENAITGEVRESTVLMTDLPMMTPSGTFIINGAERVVVSQIVRSSGVYYTSELDKKINQIKYSAQVIPTRGAWIEFEQGSKEILYAKLDRSKKVPLTTFIRALGFTTKKDIEETFGRSSLITNTFEKDETKSPNEAVIDLYSKLRQGEKVPADAAREFIRMRLFDARRYDLAKVGRYKFIKKLDVLARAEGTYLANDIILDGEVLVAKDTHLTKEVIQILAQNRDAFRKQLITKENNLQNETADEILATTLPEGGNTLYAKENVVNLKTGEVLVKKNEAITEEVLTNLRKNRHSIDEKVIKYFLTEDVYKKESLRQGVISEILDVYVYDDAGDKSNVIRIIGSDQREDRIFVAVSDIVASISYFLNLYDGLGNVDDIDHLGNRRLRLIGELLKNQFRIGLARAEKNIKDKMSTTNFNDATPANVINMTPLVGAIKTFFGSSQLSQFMDQINPLAELTQKRRVSALGTGGIARDRAGVEVRDVHNSHYGRLCPIETPEGPSIGLISSLATYAKVDEYGFIKTPFLKVVQNGNETSVTKEVIYLTADEESDHVIASAATPMDEHGLFIESRVIARRNGETGIYDANEITAMDVSPKQVVSVATSSIPFLEHDDASRALMGANMQRQAVPLLQPTSPIVGTGVEYRAAKDSGAVVIAKNSGYVTYVDGKKIIITPEPTDTIKSGSKTLYKVGGEFDYGIAKKLYETKSVQNDQYDLVQFFRSNQDTLILQKPIVMQGEYVDAGDVIADGPSTENGELALGRNVTVAFMTWEGYNYEDAVIMSEDLVKHDVYTSIHIDEYEIETRDLKQANGKEEITREIPNVGQEAIKFLDERGIIVPGSEVKEGDILVGKITPKGVFEPTPSEKLIHAVIGDKAKEYRDSSLRVPHGGGGVVQSVQYFSKKNGDQLPTGVNEQIRVYIAKKRKITEGDKMAGRHGNKGVISKILPREDMPYLADGTYVDIMLNPLGVPSRMNIGQILEIHLGISAQKLGIKVASPVFDGVTNDELGAIMEEAGIAPDGKTTLYDGRTGEPYNNRISVGVMYMIKLSHMVDDKLHARNVGPYTLVTQQPMGGKAQNGGQRFGEMEVWALYAYGAAHTLQEMLTIKSDDMIGRNKVYYAITHGQEIPKASIPESFRVLTRELQALGLYVELIDANKGENEAIKSLVDNSSKGFNKGRF